MMAVFRLDVGRAHRIPKPRVSPHLYSKQALGRVIKSTNNLADRLFGDIKEVCSKLFFNF